MYKRASRTLLHAHGVDRASRTGGAIDAPDYADDLLAQASTMTLEKAEEERRRCLIELERFNSENAMAKAVGNAREIALAGERIQVCVRRLNALNTRIKQLKPLPDAQRHLDSLRQALSELVAEEKRKEIYARAVEIRSEG